MQYRNETCRVRHRLFFCYLITWLSSGLCSGCDTCDPGDIDIQISILSGEVYIGQTATTIIFDLEMEGNLSKLEDSNYGNVGPASEFNGALDIHLANAITIPDNRIVQARIFRDWESDMYQLTVQVVEPFEWPGDYWVTVDPSAETSGSKASYDTNSGEDYCAIANYRFSDNQAREIPVVIYPNSNVTRKFKNVEIPFAYVTPRRVDDFGSIERVTMVIRRGYWPSDGDTSSINLDGLRLSPEGGAGFSALTCTVDGWIDAPILYADIDKTATIASYTHTNEDGEDTMTEFRYDPSQDERIPVFNTAKIEVPFLDHFEQKGAGELSLEARLYENNETSIPITRMGTYEIPVAPLFVDLDEPHVQIMLKYVDISTGNAFCFDKHGVLLSDQARYNDEGCFFEIMPGEEMSIPETVLDNYR